MSERYSFAFSAETGYEWLMDHACKWVSLTEPEDRTWYRDLAPVLVRLNEQDIRITELEAENARLREAVRKAFQEYAEDQGECIGCGWPASKLQQKHGDGCFIGAALQEGSDD